MIVAESERLQLCRYESEAQRESLRALFADPEVSRHLLVAFTREEGLEPNAERFRRNFDATWERCGFGGVLVHERGERRACGFVALKPDTAAGRPAGAFEVYFGMSRDRWGRGLASEALRATAGELVRRLRPAALRAAVNAAQSGAACRVLEKTGFAREGEVSLCDYASPALAGGSLELELWRIGRACGQDTVLEQAAFRIGQLARAAQRTDDELARALGIALRAGGFGKSSADAAQRAFEAGQREARYALYRHGNLGG